MSHRNVAEIGSKREDAYYVTLNVSKNASQREIYERYRELSLALHPDKHNTNLISKEVATEQFYLIQKAYEVLSDPVLRKVYDELGEEGVSVLRSDETIAMPETELNAILQNVRQKLKDSKLENDTIFRGSLKCSINATPITHSIRTALVGNTISTQTVNAAGPTFWGLRYSIKKRVRPSTEVGLTAHLRQTPYAMWIKPAFYGTIKHQFSPTLSSSLRVFMLSPHTSTWNVNYSSNNFFVGAETSILPPSLFNRAPAFNFVMGRRFSPKSLTQGVLQIQMQKQPTISFQVVWPSSYDSELDDLDESNKPSLSSFILKPGALYGSCGIIFHSVLPSLVGEIGMMIHSLQTRIGSKISFGFGGLSLGLFAKWTSPTAEIGATTALDSRGGLILQLDISYMQQRFTLPIILSAYEDTWTNFFGMAVTSTAAILAYYFVLLPRNRAQILRKLREAQKDMENDHESDRKLNTLKEMLNDIAQRQIRAEKTVDGLIIESASYGPREVDFLEGKDLFVDVTVPIQALVRKSQLYIKSGDVKGNIPGFSDPTPLFSKMLRIKYTFRGESHYAEVPDYIPVVLPLAEHRSSV